MRNGYKVTLGVLTVMILITITIGTSYSYYSVSDVQTEENNLTATCFNVNFSESDVIKLTNTYPMADSKATSTLTPYKMTVSNQCTTTNATKPVKYDISLNTVTGAETNLVDYLRYRVDASAAYANGTSAPAKVAGTADDLKLHPYQISSGLKTQYNVQNSYTLATGTLEPGMSKSFDVYMWINENATTAIAGYTFSGKVLVYAYM